MGKYIETVPKVTQRRGNIRVELTDYGLDGMSVVTTGELLVITPHVARALYAQLGKALKAHEAEISENVVEMKRA